MADNPQRWNVEEGVPEVVVCFGCGTTMEEFDAIECPDCGELFCTDACVQKYECSPQVDPEQD